MQDVFGTCLARERSARRAVIGVDVRIDDEFYCESCFLRDAQVRRRRIDWIDDGGSRAPASAKEVRRRDDGLCVKELAKNHDLGWLVLATLKHNQSFPDSDRQPACPPVGKSVVRTSCTIAMPA